MYLLGEFSIRMAVLLEYLIMHSKHIRLLSVHWVLRSFIMFIVALPGFYGYTPRSPTVMSPTVMQYHQIPATPTSPLLTPGAMMNYGPNASGRNQGGKLIYHIYL